MEIFLIIFLIILAPLVLFGAYFFFSKKKKFSLDPAHILSLCALTVALLALLIPRLISHFEKEEYKRTLYCALATEVQKNKVVSEALREFVNGIEKPEKTYLVFSDDITYLALANPAIKNEIRMYLFGLGLSFDILNTALEGARLSSVPMEYFDIYKTIIAENLDDVDMIIDNLLKALDDEQKRCINFNVAPDNIKLPEGLTQ